MEWWNQIPLGIIALGAGVLALIAGAWALFERKVNPTSARIEEPDAEARLTGKCGDTMEVRLKIRGGVVTAASYWAGGCGPSSACAAAATRLATGRPLDLIPETIDPEAIERAVGGLPPDQRHCAALACETLMEAVHRYFLRRTGGPGSDAS